MLANRAWPEHSTLGDCVCPELAAAIRSTCRLFKNLILNEFIKRSVHRGENRQPYFWLDNHGKEIDCLLVNGEEITPVEIKSGKTISASYFYGLKYWRALTNFPENQGFGVYGGEQSLHTSSGTFISWRELDRIPD